MYTLSELAAGHATTIKNAITDDRALSKASDKVSQTKLAAAVIAVKSDLDSKKLDREDRAKVVQLIKDSLPQQILKSASIEVFSQLVGEYDKILEQLK